MFEFTPQLWLSLKNYSKRAFQRDVMSGIIIAIIAFPLSIALALASGVDPEEGIYTAIVAGFVIACFGGSKVQVSGPTAAFATIVAGIVAKHGMDGLMTATVIAGFLLILMGIFRMGALLKYIPYTITAGFTIGIATTILIGQLKDFFGLTFTNNPIGTIAKLNEAVSSMHTMNFATLAIGCLALGILFFGKKIRIGIPPSLIVVIVTAIIVEFFDLPVYTIGDLYKVSGTLPSLHIPNLSYDLVAGVLPDAFTIAILAAIESLLSAVVADELTKSTHNSNMELVGQGLGNTASALFGGIPATGAIARTAANIANGAVSPVSSIVHALVLLLSLVVLMPYAAMIPMSCIAAILFQVAYNMSGINIVIRVLKKAPKSDTVVLLFTFFLTVFFDLVIAITMGIILACLLFMKRMADVSSIKEWKYLDEDEGAEQKNLKPVPSHVMVYEIIGPMFFGAADKIPHIKHISDKNVLILRMRAVPALDVTALKGLRRLREECMRYGIHLIFSHVNEQPLSVFKKSGFYNDIGAENFQPNIDAAMERAKKFA